MNGYARLISIVALAAVALPAAVHAADSLPLPKSVVIDRSIPASQREAMSLAARRYYAFWDTSGDGRPIEFIATDIYRIANGRIAENWHLEDNLTLLQQLGAVAK